MREQSKCRTCKEWHGDEACPDFAHRSCDGCGGTIRFKKRRGRPPKYCGPRCKERAASKRRASRPTSGPVCYFVRPEGSNKVKIGWSGDIQGRIRSYITSFPGRPVVLLLLDDDWSRSVEKAVHRELSGSSAGREWFYLDEAVCGYMAKHGARVTEPVVTAEQVAEWTRKYAVNCEWCGSEFRATRSYKRFCSSRCRHARKLATDSGEDGPSTRVKWCVDCGGLMRPKQTKVGMRAPNGERCGTCQPLWRKARKSETDAANRRGRPSSKRRAEETAVRRLDRVGKLSGEQATVAHLETLAHERASIGLVDVPSFLAGWKRVVFISALERAMDGVAGDV